MRKWSNALLQKQETVLQDTDSNGLHAMRLKRMPDMETNRELHPLCLIEANRVQTGNREMLDGSDGM